MSADGSFAFAGTPSPEELARFDRNDFGNALRLIRLVGGAVDGDGEISLESAELLYLREIGWIGWNGKHWDLKLGQRLAERTAHRVAQGLMAQAALWIADGCPAKEAYGFARQTGNAGNCAAMLRIAESYLQVDLDDFDRDPLAITVRNATLKFEREAGDALRVRVCAHDPGDRITRMAAVSYDPKADCPTWLASVAQWQPDPEIQGFLQRVAGYVFTGYTHEQIFVILQGKGRDGKSTFVGALRELAGDYGDVADVRTFLDTGQRGGADASPDLARLAGDCRLVSVAEPPRGAKLAEAMIKSFTGGAPIPARRLRQDIFTFTPKPKVIMECNSRPVIRGDDEGIWRRICLVMFEHQVGVGDVDRELPAKLRAEYPGILNWVIAGIAGWRMDGLSAPERVTATLDDYRKGSSPFGEWFAERLDLDESAVSGATELYQDYKKWADDNGIERAMSQTAFGNAMADRQIILGKKDRFGKKTRMGARLRPRDLPLDDADPGSPSAGGGFEGGFDGR